MDNPEKLATLGTQDIGRRQTKQDKRHLGRQDIGRRQTKQTTPLYVNKHK